MDLFPDLPDDARLWTYAADRPLTDDEQAHLKETLGTFSAEWRAHGQPVASAFAVVADRFLVIAAHVPGGDLSGCGIDASTRALAGVAQDLGFSWAAPLDVFFRDAAGHVRSEPRPAFRRRVAGGEVTGATRVFDTSLHTLGALRAQGLERPAYASWHGRVFRIAAEAS